MRERDRDGRAPDLDALRLAIALATEQRDPRGSRVANVEGYSPQLLPPQPVAAIVAEQAGIGIAQRGNRQRFVVGHVQPHAASQRGAMVAA